MRPFITIQLFQSMRDSTFPEKWMTWWLTYSHNCRSHFFFSKYFIQGIPQTMWIFIKRHVNFFLYKLSLSNLTTIPFFTYFNHSTFKFPPTVKKPSFLISKLDVTNLSRNSHSSSNQYQNLRKIIHNSSSFKILFPLTRKFSSLPVFIG